MCVYRLVEAVFLQVIIQSRCLKIAEIERKFEWQVTRSATYRQEQTATYIRTHFTFYRLNFSSETLTRVG